MRMLKIRPLRGEKWEGERPMTNDPLHTLEEVEDLDNALIARTKLEELALEHERDS